MGKKKGGKGHGGGKEKASQQPPQQGAEQQRPQQGAAQQRPQQGAAQQQPQQGVAQQQPHQVTIQQQLHQGAAQQQPQQGAAQQQPHQGASQQQTQQGAAQQRPQQGASQQRSQQGAAQQRPQQGAVQQPPHQGAAQQPPNQGASQQPSHQSAAQQPPHQGTAQQPPHQSAAQQPPRQGASQQQTRVQAWGRGRGKPRINTSPGEQHEPPGTQQQQPFLPRAKQVPQESPRGQYETQPQQPAQLPAPKTCQQPLQQPQLALEAPEQVQPQQTTTSPQTPAKQMLALRKNKGTKGRSTVVESNHMEIMIRDTNEQVYHYDVSFEPDKPKRLLRPAFAEFVRQACPNKHPAFDGRKNMFSLGLLPFGETLTLDVKVNNVERDKMEDYKVTVKKVNSLSFKVIKEFLKSPLKQDTPQLALQALDIILRQTSSVRFTPVGRSLFTPPPPGRVEDLGNGLELWVGVFQSAVLGWKPFLNVDVAHKGFPKSQPVLDLICELFRYKYSDLNQELLKWQVDELQHYLRGLKVEYEIPKQPNSKRTYRVNSVQASANQLTFTTNDDGTEETLTVQTYFHRERHYSLQYPKMPCLHVGSINRKIYIPVELCIVAGGQVTIKKMDEVQTSVMIKKAATPADVRKAKIMESFNKLGLNQDPCLKEFGITVSEKMQQVEARVLVPPSLSYFKEAEEKPVRGVWRAERKQFYKSGQIQKWAIINLENRTFDNKIREFAKMLKEEGCKLGMSIPECSNVYNIDPRKHNYIDKLAELTDCCLVVVIVPDKGDIYGIVKQKAELMYGVLTQCVKSTTVNRKMNFSTAYNILLKVNAKLNGINHALHPTSRPSCFKTPVMIMGADVTHPSPDSKDYPSIAAVTASHDVKAFEYNIEWRLQPPRQEIISDLEDIFKSHLLFFFRKTKYKPRRVIFYRDGVSDGQFAEVLTKELSAMRRACQKLESGYQPQITFLVVQKRHHTRFFPINKQDEDGKNKNVPPGLVVDTVITHPRDMDFYLVSHQSIQGTSRPTKYCVLYDDADMSEDDVEELTYYLCHLFSRCNRSVSYPAPTYYAHLAAFRAKAYIEGQRINIDKLSLEQQRRVIQEKIKKDFPMFFV